MMTTTSLKLFYGDVLVGAVDDVLFADGTSSGKFIRDVRSANGTLAARLVAFQEFCERWNAQASSDKRNPPDPAEFNQYADILNSKMWAVEDSSGNRAEIDQAPVFFPGGEVSWRLAEPMPSPVSRAVPDEGSPDEIRSGVRMPKVP